jgi:hypothetical protein
MSESKGRVLEAPLMAFSIADEIERLNEELSGLSGLYGQLEPYPSKRKSQLVRSDLRR